MSSSSTSGTPLPPINMDESSAFMPYPNNDDVISYGDDSQGGQPRDGISLEHVSRRMPNSTCESVLAVVQSGNDCHHWMLTYLYSYPDYIEPDSFFAKSENYLPTNIMFVQSVMKQECSQALTVFFDSGLKYTCFNETALPIDATPLLLSIRLLLEVLSK